MGDVNWRRAFAISSLILALFLVCGSIYLHLQKKHHLGRLNHEPKDFGSYAVADAASDVSSKLPTANNKGGETSKSAFIEYYYELEHYSDESTEDSDLNASNENHQSFRKLLTIEHELPAVVNEQDLFKNPHQITEACLQCICETTTQCQPSTCANNEPCGVFRIHRPYWIDGGRLRLSGDKSGPKEQGPDADYANCVNNAYCAARTVIGFMNKYTRDCNSDGKIDCRDFISLHVLGPGGCRMSTLSPIFTTRMEECLIKFS